MGDYYGLPTHSLSSPHLQLEYLAQAGPRIVRLSLDEKLYPQAAHLNLLAESPEVRWETPQGMYSLYGGHRLWHAPEALGRSSIPDDFGLKVEKFAGGVRLLQPVEAFTGIRKALEIRLHPQRPRVALLHCLSNLGAWSVELAPWAITQLPLGGLVRLPQPRPSSETSSLHPNRCLVFWPYTHSDDPRLHMDDDYITLDAQPQEAPAKWGYLNQHGWVSYHWQGISFTKRFKPQPQQPHADLGCNVEVFIKDKYLELETLGPLVHLEPGETVTYQETWVISVAK